LSASTKIKGHPGAQAPTGCADLADSLAVSAATVRDYLSYLDTVFLVSQVRA